MAISRKLLNADESVVATTRTHVKAMLGPALLLILLAAVAGLLGSLAAGVGAARPLLLAVIWGAAGLVALLRVVRPFLDWVTTSYTVTDQRLITRTGILARRGHDVPLARVSDVSYERGVVDRLLGCGTLLVSVAGRQRVRLDDIPHVEQMHLRMQDLLGYQPETEALHLEGPRHHRGR